MQIFIPALWIAAGISAYAGLQFVVFGLIRREQQVYLAFGVLCLILAVYMLFSPQWYQAETVPGLAQIARYQMGLICLIYPVFIWFAKLYTHRKVVSPFLVGISLVFGGLFILNIWSPYSFLYSEIAPAAPIHLPWGETVSNFDKQIAPVAIVYYAATYTVFGWTIWRCYELWRAGHRARALVISAYVLVQFLVVLHAELVDNLGLDSVYLGEFAFLILVLLVSVSLTQEFRLHAMALEKSITDLQKETARREKFETRLRYLAHHDHLTDLPNRRAMPQNLEQVRGKCLASGNFGAMLLIDLDHFKTINDALGHELGDRVLRLVADRLRNLMPQHQSPIRLGGDEFAILLSELDARRDEAEAQAVLQARTLRDAIVAPLQIAEHELMVGASIGIFVFDGKSQSLSEIMQFADMALYRAKALGRDSIEVFTPNLKLEADQRHAIDKGLRLAVENHEIELYFQPQVALSGEVSGTEVLARWRHPGLGEIPPIRFIPVAEETGLIHAIGEYILHQACQTLRNWRDRGVPCPPRLSINVSPWQLSHTHFTDMISRTLAATGIEPAMLNLEITESTFLRDIKLATEKIHALSKLGINFSIDDFGTGYSALVWLKNLHVHELKIDRHFVRDIVHVQNDELIETILAIARHMGMRVIAEGVETEVQREALEMMGCRIFQGYLISRPLPETEYRQWLQERYARSA